MTTTKTWLYHINPESPQRYTYGWKLDSPKTLFRTSDKEWHAHQMFKKIAKGDWLCVYMKNIRPNADGVYIVGRVSKVNVDERSFVWEPDEKRSAVIVSSPIRKEEVQGFFGRSYGAGMQELPPAKQKEWLRRLGRGEVIEGVPLVKAQGIPRALSPSPDPISSRKHGVMGELFVIKLLLRRYPRAEGFDVVHVSKTNVGSNHDISVIRGSKIVRLVEVKTRVGVPGDPVMISEHELECRRANHQVHGIFIVYLNKGGSVRSVLEIGSRNLFALAPRQHWLTPGFPGENQAAS